MVAIKPAQTVDVIVTHNHDKQTISKSLAHTLPSSIPTIAICCIPFMAANTSPIAQHVARQYTWQFAWVRGCPRSVHAAVPPLWLTVDSFASRRGGTLTASLLCFRSLSVALLVRPCAIQMIEGKFRNTTSNHSLREQSLLKHFPRGTCSAHRVLI